MLELSTGIIEADIIMARQALDIYKGNTRLKDVKNMCAYHLQQAVEKMVKIQIYKSGVDYDNKSMYSHNIRALLVYAERKNINIIIPGFIKENASVITKWEAGSRYDLHFSIRSDTLEKYLKEIEAWYQQIIRCLGKK